MTSCSRRFCTSACGVLNSLLWRLSECTGDHTSPRLSCKRDGACGVFSGRLSPPVEEEVREGLEAERRVRNQVPRPQFPHGDYVGMTERLAKLVGVHPTDLLAEDNPLQKLLFDGPLLPFHYRLVGFWR